MIMSPQRIKLKEGGKNGNKKYSRKIVLVRLCHVRVTLHGGSHEKCNVRSTLPVSPRPCSGSAAGKYPLWKLLLRTCCDGPKTVAISNT